VITRSSHLAWPDGEPTTTVADKTWSDSLTTMLRRETGAVIVMFSSSDSDWISASSDSGKAT